MKRVILSVMFGIGGIVSVAGAATQSSVGSSTSPTDSADVANAPENALPPADFVMKAGIDGMAEVQLAQLALQKTQNPSVKNFARQMVSDHTKVNTKLASIASAKQITAPTQLDAEHQDVRETLSTKSGLEFDAAYVAQMSTAHDKAIALFTSATASGDPDIAAFATKTLPTLKMHKQMVGKLQKAIAAANM